MEWRNSIQQTQDKTSLREGCFTQGQGITAWGGPSNQDMNRDKNHMSIFLVDSRSLSKRYKYE